MRWLAGGASSRKLISPSFKHGEWSRGEKLQPEGVEMDLGFGSVGRGRKK
jgi:hypothetical protein